jgi:hypothetical protein
MTKIRRLVAAAFAAVALFAFGSAASAATVFNFTSNPAGLFSGTVTIDTVNGTVLAADLTVAGFSPDFTIVNHFTVNGLVTLINENNAPAGPFDALQFSAIPLIGYSGGAINILALHDCSEGSLFQVSCNDATFFHASGTATATPLPAALPMFGGGIATLALLGRRRKSRAAA